MQRALDLLLESPPQEGTMATLLRPQAAQIHQRQRWAQEMVRDSSPLRRTHWKRTQKQVHPHHREAEETGEEQEQNGTVADQLVFIEELRGSVHNQRQKIGWQHHWGQQFNQDVGGRSDASDGSQAEKRRVLPGYQLDYHHTPSRVEIQPARFRDYEYPLLQEHPAGHHQSQRHIQENSQPWQHQRTRTVAQKIREWGGKGGERSFHFHINSQDSLGIL